jgi:hypothetical protein
MFLLSHCIRFADPRRKLIIEFGQTVEPKRVQMISRRKSLNAGKARMLNTARENKVTDEVVTPHLHSDERHPHLKSYAGVFWQHLHWPTFLNHRGERVEQLPHVLALSREV